LTLWYISTRSRASEAPFRGDNVEVVSPIVR